jgi:hypothetical protein
MRRAEAEGKRNILYFWLPLPTFWRIVWGVQSSNCNSTLFFTTGAGWVGAEE